MKTRYRVAYLALVLIMANLFCLATGTPLDPGQGSAFEPISGIENDVNPSDEKESNPASSGEVHVSDTADRASEADTPAAPRHDGVVKNITLSTSISTHGEEDGATSVTVTATLASTYNEDKTITITVEGSGTASAVDFDDVDDFDLTVNAGATTGTATFTLTPINDVVDETDETITISSSSTGVTVVDATITLTDDDETPVGLLLARRSENNVQLEDVGEEDGKTTIKLSLTVRGGTTYGTDQAVTVSVTGSGTASAVDFEDVDDFDITLKAGIADILSEFEITPTDDNVDETNETVTVSGTSDQPVDGFTFTIVDDDAAPGKFTLSVDKSSVDEDDGATEITVTATLGGTTRYATDQILPITFTNSRTDHAVDYSASNFNLTVEAGEKTGTAKFTLTPENDSEDEVNETVYVYSTSSRVSGSASISLKDDDAAPGKFALKVDKTTVDEGDGATTVTVTAELSGTTTYATAKTLPISVSKSSTASAVDFEKVDNFNLTVAVGKKSGTATFTLTPTDDSEDETDETVTISSTSSLVSGSTTLTLTDDDAAPGKFTLAVDEDELDESDGATTITVTAELSGTTTYATAQTLPIEVAGSGTGSAVDFADVSNFNLSVSAGNSSGTASFTLTPTDDSEDETDETVTISSSSSLVSGTATITIEDDDAAPGKFTLSVNKTTVEEDDGATEVTVTAELGGSTTFATDQTLSISVQGSGTTTAVDFATVSDFNLTVDAGDDEGTATFTLTPTDDTEDETNETVTISGPSSLVSGNATITIEDDDAAPGKFTLSVSPTSVDEDDGATEVTVTAKLGGSTTFATNQTLSISVKKSSTVSAVDFSPVSDFNLTVDAGDDEGSATFTLTPTNDSVDETDETITISSSSSLVSGNATITLGDDDATPSITLSVSPTSVDEDDGATTVTVTATVGGSIRFATAQTLPITVTGSGTESAVDFSPVSNFNLTINAGAVSGTATFMLTPKNDTVDETDETITVSSTSSLVSGSASLTLIDDDGTPSMKLSVSPTEIDEDAGATEFTVTATLVGSGTYATDQVIAITATGSGSEDAVDYAPVSSFNLTVDAGESSGTATFTLTPTNDVLDESNETITISSTSALVSTSATITIKDDDATPSISLSVNKSSVNENGGATSITVTATVGGSTRFAAAQTLPITVTGSGTGSAVDFAPVSKFNLNLSAGAASGTASFTITPTNDSVDESDETVTVGSSSSLVSSNATITISDDDATPTSVGLTVSPATVLENAGTTAVTVTASIAGTTTFGTAQTIPLTVAGSGVAGAVDFQPVQGFDLTIAAEATTGTAQFNLTPISDSEYETDETVTISSTNSLVSGDVTVSLLESNSAPSITLSVSPTTVNENDGATTITVTASLGGAARFATANTLPITVTGSGNASAVDFSPVANFNLSVDAGASTGTATFTLSPIDDSDYESDETITIASTSPFVSGSATISLNDDDAAPNILLSASPASVLEHGGPTEITVTAFVSGGVLLPDQVVLPIVVTGSGIADAVAFEPVPEFDLTIPEGASTGTATFLLTPSDDAIAGQDETVTITSSHEFVSDESTITILDNDHAGARVSLTASHTVIYEDGGAIEVTVSAALFGAATFSDDQSIPITVRGSGAADATGFLPVGELVLIIPANTTFGSVTFLLTPDNNSLDEINDVITISSTNSLVIDAPTIRLIDDDDVGIVELSVSPSTVSEAMPRQTIQVTARLSGAGGFTYSTDRVFPLSVSGSGIESAVGFETVADFDLIMSAGATVSTTSFELVPINDNVAGTDEQISISSTALAIEGPVTVTLTDDDQAPQALTLAVNPSSISEDDGPTQVTVTAQVTGEVRFSSEHTLSVSVRDSGPDSGVRFAPVSDFSVTIPAGAPSGASTFEIVPTNNNIFQPDGEITITSSSALVTDAVTIPLTNDDDAPAGIVLSATPSIVSEDAGSTQITIEAALQGGTAFSAQQTLSITAKGSGLPHVVDFAAVEDFELVVPAAAERASVTIELVPVNDAMDEQDEVITFSSSSTLVTQTASVTIVDDDAAPSGIAAVLNPSSLVESAGATEVVLQLSLEGGTVYATKQTYDVSVAASGQAGVVGFAPIASFEATIEPGESTGSARFTITPQDNLFDESDETVAVTAKSSTHETTAYLTLTDDDDAPTEITITTDPVGLGEGDGPTPIQVTIAVEGDSRYAAMHVIKVSVAGGSAGTVGFEPVPDFSFELPPGAGSATGTITITPHDNMLRDEPALIQINADLNGLVATATIVLRDDDEENDRVVEVNAALLPEMTRAFSSSTVEAVSRRIQEFSQYYGRPLPSASQTLTGLVHGLRHERNRHMLPGASEPAWGQRLDGRQIASGISGRIAAWGQADYRALSGQAVIDAQVYPGSRPIGYDGQLTGYHAGLDFALPGGVLVGVSGSQMRGSLDYDYSGPHQRNPDSSTLKGSYEGNMRSLSPYLSWTWSSGSGIWAMVSRGDGDISLADDELQRETSDTRLESAAAGTRFRLLPARKKFSLAIKAAGWLSRMKLLENASRVTAMDVEVSRVQVSLESSYRIGFTNGGSFQPFVEAGVRADFGDGQQGFGVETAGGMRLDIASAGLSIAGRGRYLLHHISDLNEYGYGGTLRFAPGGTRGLSVALASSIGNMFGGAQRIWMQDNWQAGRGMQTMMPRWRSDIGYGIDAGVGVVTPYGGVTHANGMQGNAGVAFQAGSRLSMRMELMHRMQSGAQPPFVRGLITLR